MRSNFEIITDLIRKLERGQQLAEEQRTWLESYLASSAYARLPEVLPPTAHGQSLFLLRLAATALGQLVDGKPQPALDTLWEQREALTTTSPFAEAVLNLALHLATTLDDAERQTYLRKTLRSHHELRAANADRHLIEDLGSLFDPEVMARLEPGLEALGLNEPEPHLPGTDELPAGGRYRGGARPEDEHGTPGPNFGIVLFLAMDPYHGVYRRLEAELVDETAGDPLGRLAEDGHTYADLRLSVPVGEEQHVTRLLGHPELAARLVFRGGHSTDFAAADHTLLVTDAKALTFSLRVPESWLERDVPLRRVLRDLQEILLVPRNTSAEHL